MDGLARDDRVRVVLRPYGTPVALGLTAIILGTLMLTGLQLEWLSGAGDQRTVGLVGIAAAFPLELIAAIFAFLARDALAATGLGTFSSVWSVSGLSLLTSRPGTTSNALGMFLLIGAGILALLIVSAGPSRLVLGFVLLCGCARLSLTGFYEIDAGAWLKQAAGISGLVLAGACVYALVSLLSEDIPGRSLLPAGRSGRAAASLEGAFAEQLHDLEHEAGVRRQL